MPKLNEPRSTLLGILCARLWSSLVTCSVRQQVATFRTVWSTPATFLVKLFGRKAMEIPKYKCN